MTREEAIRWLEDIHRRFNPTGEKLENEGGDVHLQAIDMAIEALRNCSEKPNGSLISKEDAIEAMDKLWGDIKRTHRRVAKGHEAVYLDMRGTIKTLPSAEPLVLTCDGCRHVGTYDIDFPCQGCIRREKDYYEPEE